MRNCNVSKQPIDSGSIANNESNGSMIKDIVEMFKSSNMKLVIIFLYIMNIYYIIKLFELVF